jgi:hypothetical protein
MPVNIGVARTFLPILVVVSVPAHGRARPDGAMRYQIPCSQPSEGVTRSKRSLRLLCFSIL